MQATVTPTTRFTISAAESTLTFEATSNFHKVAGRCTALSGFVLAEWNADGTLQLTPAPEMHIELRVIDLHTGNRIQDEEMWKLIDSSRFPKVAADLRKASPGQRSDHYWASGNVTFAGRARPYQGELTARRDGNRLTLGGELTLDLRHFAVDAPRMLSFKVGSEIKIKLRAIATLD